MSHHWSIYRKDPPEPEANYLTLLARFPTPATYTVDGKTYYLFVDDMDGFEPIDEDSTLEQIQALVAVIINEPVKLLERQAVLWADAL